MWVDGGKRGFSSDGMLHAGNAADELTHRAMFGKRFLSSPGPRTTLSATPLLFAPVCVWS